MTQTKLREFIENQKALNVKHTQRGDYNSGVQIIDPHPALVSALEECVSTLDYVYEVAHEANGATVKEAAGAILLVEMACRDYLEMDPEESVG